MRKTSFKPTDFKGYVCALKPYSRNKAQILAFNRAHEGPPSNVVSFTTPEGSEWRWQSAPNGWRQWGL